MAETFTFDNTLSTALSRVRLKSGDFLSTDPILYDESIAALLELHSDDELAVAIEVVKAALTRFAREDASRSAAGVSTGNSRHASFQEVLKRLEAEQGGSVAGGVTEFVAGSSYAERDEFDEDSDFIPWSF